MPDGKKDQSLSVLRIGLMYIGVLLGAGFASGKEMWQFFGVFGGRGLIGVLIVTVIFTALGCVVVANASALGTNDMSRIVFPYQNPWLESIISGIIILFLFKIYIL